MYTVQASFGMYPVKEKKLSKMAEGVGLKNTLLFKMKHVRILL
jgi:hypothetical protein